MEAAPGRTRRVVVMRALVPLALLLAAACAPGGGSESDGTVIFRLDPVMPSVGTAAIEARLVDPAGEPLPGAEVTLEANMSHAGMVPTFADLTESDEQPGLYVGTVEFTMAGDWFLLLEARLPDGRVIERQLDVPGVRP